MANHTYMQIREHGEKGWAAFVPALLLSERLDTWMPSGDDIEAARKSGFPFDDDDMIALIEARIFRVGVREGNLKGQRLFNSGTREFDRHIRRLFDKYSGPRSYSAVVVHPEYECAQSACIDLINGCDAQRSLVFKRAEQVVAEGETIPSIVWRRATEFLEKDLSGIDNPHIREATSYIRKRYATSAKQRLRASILYHLMRLSLEHVRIMNEHGCNVPFTYRGDLSTMCYVAGFPRAKDEAGTEISESQLGAVVDLIGSLMGEAPPRSANEFIKLHARIGSQRQLMWGLACGAQHPIDRLEEDLRDNLNETTLFQKLFGKDLLGRIIGGTAAASTVINAGLALVSGSYAKLAISLGISSATYIYRYLKATKEEFPIDGESHLWPFMIMYDRESPSTKDVRAMMDALNGYRPAAGAIGVT